MTDDRTEWLQWRRTGITATDAAAVVGLSPYASPWSLWADKVGLYQRADSDPGPHARFGLRMEPVLARWFWEDTGLTVVGAQTWATHPDDPWRLATLDGYAVENLDGAYVAGVESKTTTDPVGEWRRELPVHIRVQCQWQMGVTGLARTLLPTLHHGYGVEFAVHEIERDEADLAWLLEQCREFWHTNVLGQVPPDVDIHKATHEALQGAWDGNPDSRVEADDALLDTYWQLREVRTQLAMLEAREELLSNTIRAALGDRSVLTHGMAPAKGKREPEPLVLATWKPSDTTRLDPKALRERLPRTAARFSTTTTSRRLLIKEPKGYQR